MGRFAAAHFTGGGQFPLSQTDSVNPTREPLIEEK
jgi:hypothetical protein